MVTRREFVKAGGLAGSAMLLGLGRAPLAAGPQATGSINLLVLGGTGFIGPHLVRLAVSRGHKVTIFTRGRRNPELPEGIERLTGDRNGDLKALEGKRWDAVVDDSATNPDWVKLSTDLLKDAVGRYLFTSSTGVYYPYLKRGLDESDPLHYEAADPNDGSETYAVNKARCERTVLETFGGDRGTVVRPSYIVGPGDTTDRFPYWPVRFAQGGEILCPGRAEDPVQLIDVRDLTALMLRLVEQGRSGIYNAVGPKTPMTSREFYRAARKTLNRAATLTYIEDYAFLKAHGIEYSIPWGMLEGNDDGMMSIRNERALAAGLTITPLDRTLRDTLAWWPTVPEDRRKNPKFNITPEIEVKALADWRARGAAKS
jgi:nucleoside-diphosphate-sugar epimerase